MKTTKEMIEVMKGYEDGKIVQYKTHDLDGSWLSLPHPSWDWAKYDYRIKPEKKTRPITAKELCERGAIRVSRDRCSGWHLIDIIDKVEDTISFQKNLTSISSLIPDYKWMDYKGDVHSFQITED